MVKATTYHPALNKARLMYTLALSRRVDIYNDTSLTLIEMNQALSINNSTLESRISILNTLSTNKIADTRRVK